MKNDTLSYALEGRGRLRSFVFYLTLLLTSFSASLVAQNIQVNPSVQPVNGGTVRVGNFVVDWTLGQPAQTVLRNGNLMITQGFEQPEKPLPPVAPASQSVCSDTAYTFTFANVLAGAGADQVEWSLHSNFDTSFIIASGDTINIMANSGDKDTVWLRSRISLTGMVSVPVISTLQLSAYPTNKSVSVDSFVLKDSLVTFTVLNSELNVWYKLMKGFLIIDSVIGNGDTIHLKSSAIDTSLTFRIHAINSGGCEVELFYNGIIYPVNGVASSVSQENYLSSILSQSDRNFYEIKTEAKEYFETHTESEDLEDVEEDGQQAKFQRWVNFWEPRVDSSGSFDTYRKSKADYLQTPFLENDCNPSDFDAKWKCIGPFESGNVQQNQGRITAIAVDPDDDVFTNPSAGPKTIYVGTSAGGIFKTENGNSYGEIQWTNITDPSGYGGVGFNSININPHQSQWIIAATNTVDPGVWISGGGDYTFGIVQSFDGGQTWEPTILSFAADKYKHLKKVLLLPSSTNERSDLIVLFQQEIYFLSLYYEHTSGGSPVSDSKILLRSPTGIATGTLSIPDEEYTDIQLDINDEDFVYLSGTVLKSAFNQWGIWTDHCFLFKIPLPGNISPNAWSNTVYDHESATDNLLNNIEINLPNVLCTPVACNSYAGSFVHDFDTRDITYLSFSLTNHHVGGSISTRIFATFQVAYNAVFSIFYPLDLNCAETFSPPQQATQPTNWNRVLACSDDGGQTWHDLITPTGEIPVSTLRCSSDNENVLYAEGRNGGPNDPGFRRVVKSVDAGNSWTTTDVSSPKTHADVRVLSVLSSNSTNSTNDVLLLGNDGGIALKEYGNTGWTSLNGYGLNIGQYLGLGNFEKNVNRIEAGAQDGSHNRYNKSWTYGSNGQGDGGDCLILEKPNGDENLVSEGNWQVYTQVGSRGGGAFLLMPLCKNPENEQEAFVGFNDVMKITFNSTITSATFDYISANGQRVTSIAKGFNPFDNNNLIYYSTTGNPAILKTVDDGSIPLTWTTASGSSPSFSGLTVTDIALNPQEAKHVFASCGNFTNGKKVFESTDAGENWTNISGCVPNFPTNSILYQPEGDRLFLGTDVGVYYGTRNSEGLFDWHKLPGIPDVQVFDMELHNCGQKLQIATFGRGIWEANIPSLPAYEITTTETWNTSRDQYASVIIEDGAVLHITGSTTEINMARGTTITIEPGGKLLVDDEATITNSCGSMWDGIIVKGNPNEPQTITSGASNQGFLVINHATIENAYEGVRLWDPNWTNGNIGTGGIVQATGANFTNNRRSAEFMQYHDLQLSFDPVSLIETPNKSYFIGCVFKTDDSHRSEHPFSAFVTAWSVAPIHFSGCAFLNDHTITEDTKDVELGDGISTIDAGIIVEDLTNSFSEFGVDYIRSSFKNLHHGIHLASEMFPYLSRVEHAQFTNCLRGIRNEGVDLCTFVGNDFVLGGNKAKITDNFATELFPIDEGIILHGEMAGFRIEQNTFTKSTEPHHWTVGIRADGTGETTKRIYNNTFSSIHIADLANRQNRFDDALNSIYSGIRYECNTNTNSTNYDFAITEPDANDPQRLQTGVRREQGAISLPAGNKFSSFTNGEGHFGDYTGKDIFYYHRNTTSDPAPIYTTPNVQFRLASIDNTCASNFAFPTLESPTGGGHLTELTFSGYASAFSLHRAAYNQYAGQLKDLLDGGNTQAMMRRADTTSNAAKLYDTLFSYSPNLSTLVLDIVAQRSSLLNDTLQYNILKANAEGMSSDVMKDWVKWAAPPQWMRDSVNAARYHLTYRSYLLDTVLYHSAEKEYALHDALRLIEEDSAGFNLSLYRTWLDSADNAWAKRKKVNSYIFEGKLDTIATMLAALDTTITKTPADSISFKNYKDYVLAYKDWIENDTFLNRLDSAHVQNLTTIAGLNEHSKGSQMARNVLNFFYDSLYFTPPMLPDVEYAKKSDEEMETSSPAAPLNERSFIVPAIKLYPNPAQNKVTIEYSGINEISKLYVVNTLGMVLDVLNLGGTQGKIELNTTAYQNGIYLIRIEAEGRALAKDKFIILK